MAARWQDIRGIPKRKTLGRIARCACVLLLAACGGSSQAEPDAGTASFLLTLDGPDDYSQLEDDGSQVKYLNRVDGRTPPDALDADCQFQDTRSFPFHIGFIRSFDTLKLIDIDTYLSLVLHNRTRVWWGGSLRQWPAVVHPKTLESGIISYTIYRENGPDEDLTVDQIVEVDARLKTCAPYAQALLVFVPDGADQESHVRDIVDQLAGQDVALLFPDELIDSAAAGN